uniref:Uncharacterized protein n=1 Tax=Daphnia magna TaxID=35525 RepID=A0A0P5DQZ4_9CRUS
MLWSKSFRDHSLTFLFHVFTPHAYVIGKQLPAFLKTSVTHSQNVTVIVHSCWIEKKDKYIAYEEDVLFL